MAVFRHSIMVEFAETDGAGVVHFSNYLRYMERVEHAFWRSLGQSVVTDAMEGHISFPRVKVDCEYLKPARFEDSLEGELTVGRIGERSVTFHIAFSVGGQAAARGSMVAVCCRVVPMKSMESIAIPDFIRKPLEAFVNGGAAAS